MSIRIGHASIDENGRSSGGVAGDQSGKEVCIRTWYSKPWCVVLRPVSSTVAEKSAAACEAGCANNCIGYDQNQRNTAHTKAKAVGYDLSKIVTKCETDCSAFMTLCAIAAGVTALEYDGNAPTTSTMRSKFTATGQYQALTDSKYLTSDAYLKRGDILLRPGSHTVMALDDGSKATTTTTTSTGGICTVTLRTLKFGSSGSSVKALQMLLIGYGYSCGSAGADGAFGSSTLGAVKSYQKAKGLSVDGIVGSGTWGKLLGVS